MTDASQDHIYLGSDHARNERRTWIVIGITLAMMLAEITAGTLFNSMALVADGWHMFTHASALLIAALAYRFARRHAGDARFTFGTGKMGDLAAFGSAVVLGVVSLLIAWESLVRLWAPAPIAYGEAILVAVLGLAVNVGCAILLRGDHGHSHGHGHDHGHDHAKGNAHGGHAHGDHAPAPATDNNLRAAYLHVVADALTSVLAIAALLAGRSLGLTWLDPVIGLMGGVLIAHWSLGLMRDAGRVLLDWLPTDDALPQAIRARAAQHGARVIDLHVWHLGPGHRGAILSVTSAAPSAGLCMELRGHLMALPGLSHVTVEVLPA